MLRKLAVKMNGDEDMFLGARALSQHSRPYIATGGCVVGASSVGSRHAKGDGIEGGQRGIEEVFYEIDVTEIEGFLPLVEFGSNEIHLFQVLEATRNGGVASEEKATFFPEMQQGRLQVDQG